MRIYVKMLAMILPLWMALLLSVAAPAAHAAEQAGPLRVCATLPDLGSLAREVGGDQVTVTVFAKGLENPHFVEAKPSFVKALSRADLFVQGGLELEAAWAPVLLQNARNGRVLPGNPGYLDASTVIAPLEVPTGTIDRSMGDVHPEGNPHYLLDPMNGLKVARLIRDRLTELRPANRSYFHERYETFRRKTTGAMVGEKLAAKYELEKLALLYEQGRLGAFLKERKDDALLGGWLGKMLPYYGTSVVADHNMWPYFARRFGISVKGFLEPKPGVSPTTSHLGSLVAGMRSEGIRIVIATPYFDAKALKFVADKGGARIVNLAHQAGARQGADDYLGVVDYNVRALAAALAGAR
ncbi:MAG: metal ABC transporter substrate-binding protein [Geobacteraceae bacterium]|nr:metal ABC transporter substrate-binding protein [Geobacteraceae bacterium]